MKEGYKIRQCLYSKFFKPDCIVCDNNSYYNEVCLYAFYSHMYNNMVTDNTVAIFKIKYK